MVGAAQPIPDPGADLLDLLAVGDDVADRVGGVVHGLPQLPVVDRLGGVGRGGRAPGIAQLDERSWHTKFVRLIGQGDAAGKVLGLHLPDPAQGDDHPIVSDGLELVEQVDVGDGLEQLDLGVAARSAEAGGGDLQVEVADRAVLVLLAALDE